MKKDIKYRSQEWFDDPSDPGMTALYLERYLNYGLTLDELQAGRPIIGIAQTGSDLVPCNRIHLELATRIKEGIRDAGGIAIEFPVHPIQETGRRPTAALDRNLQCLSLIEVLHGYPIDGVVLTTGCDKTTPALLMGAASVNLPAIAFSSGPMLNGNYKGRCVGSGTVIWEARQKYSQGKINYRQFIDIASSSAPSAGHCNTMGTALTMNCLAEAMGMMLPGTASIPAPYRERGQAAYFTGRQIVELVNNGIKPSDILTKAAFINAIKVCAALGGSTNAPIHISAIASHIGVDLELNEWQKFGHNVPQLVNCQPVGEFLSEDFHKAGGIGALMKTLLDLKLIDDTALTVTGESLASNYDSSEITNSEVIRTVANPVRKDAGLMILSGNLFDSAVMKTSAITEEFKSRYLSDPEQPNVFIGRAIVFDGPEHYRQTIDDPALAIDEHCILVMRYTGPRSYPGSAEVVNMQPPRYLLERGIKSLPTIGDGRQSGTSSAPSILNCSPEASAGSGLAILENGDQIKIDLNQNKVDLLISPQAYKTRLENNAQLNKSPQSQTWWQEIYRQNVNDLDQGAVFEDMTSYKNISEANPRHSH